MAAFRAIVCGGFLAIACLLQAEPPPNASSTESVRGWFREFRCIASDYFEFVIVGDEHTFVLFANSPASVILLEDGKTVSKDLECGRQLDEVVATYWPGEPSPIGSEVDGRIASLEFLDTE